MQPRMLDFISAYLCECQRIQKFNIENFEFKLIKMSKRRSAPIFSERKPEKDSLAGKDLVPS